MRKALEKIRKPIFYALFLTLLLTLLWHVFLWNSTVAKPRADYFGIIMRDLFNPAVFSVREGATAEKGYIPLAFFLLVVLYALQRCFLDGRGIYVLWTNFPYFAFTLLALFITYCLSLIVQYENWYWDAARGVEGDADILTHFLALFSISAFAFNFDLMDIFGLKGFRGRALEFLFIVCCVLLFALHFEVVENLKPEIYLNSWENSLRDIFAGFAGALFAGSLYNIIVPYEE